MPPRQHRRRKKSYRKLLIWSGSVVAALVLVPLAVIGVLILTIDPNAYKARIEAAVRAATGRALHINGAIVVSASLSPTVTADDVTLANMADGSRPDMLRVDEMQIQLSAEALLTGHIVVSRMVLLRPDLLLETDAAGHANWQFSPAPRLAAAPAGPAAAPAPPAAPSQARLRLQTVHIHDARMTFRNGATGVVTVFDIPRIAATAASADSPVSFGAEFSVNRHDFTLSAQTGPLSRLQDSGAAPWALYMNVTSSGATLTVDGTVSRPLQLRGYSLRVDGAIPSLERLSWLSPVRLPALRNVSFSARLLDQPSGVPDISAVTLKAGTTQLEDVSPGFVLDNARLDMPRLSEPVVVTADGTYVGQPLRVRATIGAPAQLLPAGLIPGLVPPPGAFNIDAAVELAGASFAARGSIAAPATQSGMDIVLGARVPDLGALSPLAGRALPALKDIAFTTHLVDGPGGFWHAVGLRGAVLTLPEADVSGDATWRFAARPDVQANLVARHIDADALRALFAAAARLDAAAAPAEGLSQLAADATRPPSLPPAGNTVIPNTALPFGLLGAANLDITGRIGTLTLGGMTATDIAGHIATQDGRLAAGPITATLPGGPARLTLGADSQQAVPPVALAVTASGLDPAKLLALFGLADPVEGGALEIHADLRAAGRTLHAMAGTLEGQAGIGLTGAGVSNALLAAPLGQLLHGAGLPDLAGEGGSVALRCLVLRASAAGGVATLHTATLDSARLLLSGAGSVNLGAETMALELRPMLRTGGAGVVVPVRVDGGWRDPKVALDPGKLAAANVKGGLGLVAGMLRAKPVAKALNIGALDAGVLAAERGGDACGPALAALRAP
jgi:AsmA protein